MLPRVGRKGRLHHPLAGALSGPGPGCGNGAGRTTAPSAVSWIIVPPHRDPRLRGLPELRPQRPPSLTRTRWARAKASTGWSSGRPPRSARHQCSGPNTGLYPYQRQVFAANGRQDSAGIYCPPTTGPSVLSTSSPKPTSPLRRPAAPCESAIQPAWCGSRRPSPTTKSSPIASLALVPSMPAATTSLTPYVTRRRPIPPDAAASA